MTNEMKAVHTALHTQWQKMLDNNVIPTLEYMLPNGDYLTVDITLTVKTEDPSYGGAIRYGVFFTGDFELPTCFSGDVKKWGDSYYLPIDEYFEDLDHYLQQIGLEIVEGYLTPNNLLTD